MQLQASLDLEENKEHPAAGCAMEKMEEVEESGRGKALRIAEARSKFQTLLLNTIRLEQGH